jgi:hypothetical protein
LARWVARRRQCIRHSDNGVRLQVDWLGEYSLFSSLYSQKRFYFPAKQRGGAI